MSVNNKIVAALSEVDDADAWRSRPHVDGAKIFRNGQVIPFKGACIDVTSPILNKLTGQRITIGRIAQNSSEDAVKAFEAARNAWNYGTGEWPQMRLECRMSAINRLVEMLKLQRAEIINTLVWEICKSTADATAEFDRTMILIRDTISALRESNESNWKDDIATSVTARVRLNAVGVMVLLGPFNYPFNETYATLIPALLMGNTVVMKLPTTGGLAHVLTMEAFATVFPPGVINFISGPGRQTITPIMRMGPDILALIGGSKAADAIVREHPAPHRLRSFMSLDGKNLGIVTSDANLTIAAHECCVGTTTFNGQRCTALKMIMVHESIAPQFLQKLLEEISVLKAGLPWEEGVSITPLPQFEKVTFLTGLIDDAISKGAEVINKLDGGGLVCGNLMRPAVVFPITENMRLWHEEQMGPIIPVAIYDDIEVVKNYIARSSFGLQASVFSEDAGTVASLIDVLSTAVGRINVNTQCSRSPDTLPFTGRRSSGLGTLSITEAVKNFAVETVVAFKHTESNVKLIGNAETISTFLTPFVEEVLHNVGEKTGHSEVVQK